MPVVSVLGAKGGCGASLVATNLGVGLASRGSCLLVDLNPCLGYDDLLLDLVPRRAWSDLLPVADEVSQQHLEATAVAHSSGLKFLAAPAERVDVSEMGRVASLMRSLRGMTDWLVIDLVSPGWAPDVQILALSDLVLLVATLDAPALRAAQRLLQALPETDLQSFRLVVNQGTRAHPAQPLAVAESLGISLLAALPPDLRSVGYQVALGQACITNRSSPIGRALLRMTQRLVARETGG